VQVSKKLLYVLLGLNGVYYSGFKWVHLLLADMKIAPRDFGRRMQGVFMAEPEQRAQELEALVEETYALIEAHMPEVDVEWLRRVFRYKREPWEEALPG
jgi:hypothetical protein